MRISMTRITSSLSGVAFHLSTTPWAYTPLGCIPAWQNFLIPGIAFSPDMRPLPWTVFHRYNVSLQITF